MENEILMPNEYKECKIPSALTLFSLFTFSKQFFADDYVFKGESHNFTEAVCIMDGKVGLVADKNAYILSEGQMIIHPPGEFHSIWSDCDTSPKIIIFSFRSDTLPHTKNRIFPLSKKELAALDELYLDALTIFEFEKENVKRIKKGQELRATMLIKRLELFLLNAFSKEEISPQKPTGRSAENYLKILSVMEEHLHKPLTSKELATLCNMSVPAMEKTVYRFLGCGAIAHFNALKIQKAKKLLQEGASVKETALALGYANQNYFSARFKQSTGVSPSQWK